LKPSSYILIVCSLKIKRNGGIGELNPGRKCLNLIFLQRINHHHKMGYEEFLLIPWLILLCENGS
jgi:hypothetical protein